MNHQVDLHLTDLILSGLSVDTEAVSHRLTPTPAPRTHGDSHRVAADAVTGGDFDAGRGQISDFEKNNFNDSFCKLQITSELADI